MYARAGVNLAFARINPTSHSPHPARPNEKHKHKQNRSLAGLAQACRQRLLEALHPPGSGYRAVTAGKPANVRELACDAVRAYHSEYYRPENVAVVVTGQVR